MLVATTLLWTDHALVPTEITLFVWAIACFAAVPALQINVVNFDRDAPNFVSTLNIATFNPGNAIGAWAGGAVIDRGYGVGHVPLASGALALLALVATVIATLQRPRGPALAGH